MDEGGPLRELLHLLMTAIAANNRLFQGKEDCMPCSCPEHDRTSEGDLQVCGTNDGSIPHPCGPSPTFLAPAVVDYIVHGIGQVKGTVQEIPCQTIRRKLEEVSS